MKQSELQVTLDRLILSHADWLQSEFGLDMIKVSMSGRLSRALGYYKRCRNRVTGEVTSREIVLSKDLLQYYTDEEMTGVFRHELIHYALERLGLPYGDDDLKFIETCQKYGAPLTNVLSHKGKVHVYSCRCQHHFVKRRLRKNRIYTCNRCLGDLIYFDETIKR